MFGLLCLLLKSNRVNQFLHSRLLPVGIKFKRGNTDLLYKRENHVQIFPEHFIANATNTQYGTYWAKSRKTAPHKDF